MKKHILIITLIVLSGILTTVSAIDNNTAQNKQYLSVEESTEENVYVVKDYKGMIAIFYNDNQIPIQIFNIYTDTLPEEDAKKIKSGIKLTSKELESFISDYTS